MGSSECINILLVEDNPADAFMLNGLLTQIANGSYNIRTATSLADVEATLKNGFVPSVTFLDLSLPDSRGLDTITGMLEIASDVPIVVLTGDRDSTLIHQAAEIGIQDFLIKGESDARIFEKTICYAIERKRAERGLFERANFDALTRLANRESFTDYLKKSVARVKRNSAHLGLLYVDLDHFKTINDSLGHEVGDELLCQVGRRLSNTLREGDVIARFNGDEFTITLENIADSSSAELVATKILQALSAPFKLKEHQVVVSPSIGIAVYPNAGEDAVTLIKNADIAMYHAKERGGNSYQVYRTDTDAKTLERLDMERDLQLALEHDEFLLHYQPVIDVSTGNVCAVEALLRWDSPNRSGLVQPDKFIPILEETGLISAVGDWVLRTACEQCQTWHKSGLPDLHVAVNLSPRQLRSRDSVDWIQSALRESGLDAKYLDLEITEGVLMGYTETVTEKLESIQAMGVGLSIDDFGTGFSSLGNLMKYHLNALKIDRDLLCDVMTNQQSAVIVTAIITMAHGLGLRVIAEGVEDQEQIDFLRAQHCDEAQGYFISQPSDPKVLFEYQNAG